MTAARAGGVAAVKLLLDRRAAVDAKTSPREQTALIWAVEEINALVSALDELVEWFFNETVAISKSG